MKNLMINQDFIAKAALLDGDETKQLFVLLAKQKHEDFLPSSRRKSHLFAVSIVFSKDHALF